MISQQGLVRRRLGAILVKVAISLVVLCAFAGLAIDLTRVWTVKNELQAACDSASLAGASGLLEVSPVEGRLRAKQYATKNRANGQPVTLQDADIQFGRWNAAAKSFTLLAGAAEFDADACRVTAPLTAARGNPVGMTLSRVLGRQSVDVVASATATFGGNVLPWDVVIVQDVTASFRNELDLAKLADQALLDCIRDHAAADSLIGIVAFTGRATVFAPMQPISIGYNNLSAIIASMRECGLGAMPPCSGTDIATGLEKAIELFQSVPLRRRALVLVSDGQPNADPAGAHPSPTFSDADLARLATQWANTAWQQHQIHIFTVFFDSGNDNASAAFLASLTRGDGTFQRVPDPTELAEALGNICESLPLRLVN